VSDPDPSDPDLSASPPTVGPHYLVLHTPWHVQTTAGDLIVAGRMPHG
jgi:hypothetical protein